MRWPIIQIRCDCCGCTEVTNKVPHVSVRHVLAAGGASYNHITNIVCTASVSGWVHIGDISLDAACILRHAELPKVSDVCSACWESQDAMRATLYRTLTKLSQNARGALRRDVRGSHPARSFLHALGHLSIDRDVPVLAAALAVANPETSP